MVFKISVDELAQVKILQYRPTKIVFETSSASDQLLFLSDTWYPGWKAKLENGQELKILTADYALRVPCRFRPEIILLLCGISGVIQKGLEISL